MPTLASHAVLLLGLFALQESGPPLHPRIAKQDSPLAAIDPIKRDRDGKYTSKAWSAVPASDAEDAKLKLSFHQPGAPVRELLTDVGARWVEEIYGIGSAVLVVHREPKGVSLVVFRGDRGQVFSHNMPASFVGYEGLGMSVNVDRVYLTEDSSRVYLLARTGKNSFLCRVIAIDLESDALSLDREFSSPRWGHFERGTPNLRAGNAAECLAEEALAISWRTPNPDSREVIVTIFPLSARSKNVTHVATAPCVTRAKGQGGILLTIDSVQLVGLKVEHGVLSLTGRGESGMDVKYFLDRDDDTAAWSIRRADVNR